MARVTQDSGYLHLILELIKSDCTLELIYSAALSYYNLPETSNKRNLPLRSKIIQDFITLFTKEPYSKESETLGQRAREYMIDDFLARDIKDSSGVAARAKIKLVELSKRTEKTMENLRKTLAEPLKDEADYWLKKSQDPHF